jgi:hypothetical protein
MPSTAAEALSQAHQGRYPTPQGVVLLPEGKYMRIVLEHFGSIQDVRSYDDDTEDAYAHADD